MRAIIINLVGHDDRRCRVVFDRYGLNSAVFANGSRTDEQVTNHAVSAALTSVIGHADYGPAWTKTYTVTTIG
jgi:hypothetical protein